MAAAGDAGRAGDSVANATHDLYRQYGKQIYAYCLHQLRSREEAEDAVQTTFLNAFRGLQRGTTTRFEQAWLYKIAQNVCIARRSSSGKRLRLESPDDFEILEEVVPSGSGSTDSDTLELMGLETALEQMPENQRRAILLREWQGLSYREIAEQLDLSQGAVEMLIFRARRTLAFALEQPAVEKRTSRGKAKTGFSLGSLIAAMKGLFSTGAALKIAAVAVTAAVVSTNAVHSVVHRMTTQRHTRAAVAPQVRQASTASLVVPKASVQLVSWKAARTKVVTAGGGGGGAGAASATSPALGGSGPKPIIAPDGFDPAPSASATVNEPAASNTASASGGAVSLVAPAAPATVRATSGAGPSNPPPPPPSSGGSGTSGSGGSGSGSSSGGTGHHGGHGGGKTGGSSGSSTDSGGAGGTKGTTAGTDSGGKGAGHHHQGGGKHATATNTATTGEAATAKTTLPTTDTTTTTDATTTTTTTTSDDPSSSSDTTGTTSQTTTTTTPTTTTTTTTGDGGGSDGGSSSSGGGHGHGGGGGGGNGGGGSGGGGNGGGGNGGGGNGGGGHHHHGGGG